MDTFDVRHTPGTSSYLVIDVRTGRIVSTHKTLTAACVACRAANRSN